MNKKSKNYPRKVHLCQFFRNFWKCIFVGRVAGSSRRVKQDGDRKKYTSKNEEKTGTELFDSYHIKSLRFIMDFEKNSQRLKTTALTTMSP